ncbi:MAG: pyridoxal phosphate-dependent aminotransferase [Bacteroidales bacterium]|jgi:aspartate aminotransferase|nr:pyridoxal phosphate-dependent aminotransferase [Bacteroidales bacterium]
MLSKRILNLEESATLAMTAKSAALKQEGKSVINLSIGEPDFDTPEFIKQEAIKAINDNFTHYTPVPGILELRKAICKKLLRDNGVEYQPSQIVVSTGAKQAIANVLLSLVDPGDEVVIASPYWVSYSELVKLAEGKAVLINAGIEHDFKITAQQLEKAITPKTKLIMLNSPCNPTGSVYTKDELEALAKVVEKNEHVYVLSDEIYEHIIFKGKHECFAQFQNIKERVIVINGVSKGFAMTGWRLGFSASSLPIAKACDKLQGQITSNTNSIAQKASVVAFERDPADIPELKIMVEKFHERRDLLLDLLKGVPGVKTNIPNGAFYIFADFTYYFGKSDGEKVIKNDEDLCMYILEKTYVALVPGSAFGDGNCIRFSYATSNENLIEAISRIKTLLAKLK